jgi:hypothetical protein
VTTPLILLGLGGNVVDTLDLVDDLNRAPPSPGRVLKGEREGSGGIRRDRARLPWP